MEYTKRPAERTLWRWKAFWTAFAVDSAVCGVSVLVVATSGLWQHATLSTLCSAQAVTLRSTKLKSMHANGHEVSEIYKGTVCVYAWAYVLYSHVLIFICRHRKVCLLVCMCVYLKSVKIAHKRKNHNKTAKYARMWSSYMKRWMLGKNSKKISKISKATDHQHKLTPANRKWSLSSVSVSVLFDGCVLCQQKCINIYAIYICECICIHKHLLINIVKILSEWRDYFIRIFHTNISILSDICRN